MKKELKTLKNFMGTIALIFLTIYLTFILTTVFIAKIMRMQQDSLADDTWYTENVKKQKVTEQVVYEEEKIPDEKYYDTVEEAMKNADILFDESLSDAFICEQMKNIQDIVKEFENGDYKSVYYKTEYERSQRPQSDFVFAKFKIKEFDGVKKYAFLEAYPCNCDGYTWGEKQEAYIDMALQLSDYEQGININKDSTRFVWGTVPQKVINKKKLEKLQIEGQKPDGVIEYKNYDDIWYFWYYEDLKSDKPGSQLEYTIGRRNKLRTKN
ncbi:MAG: hypothetical protein SO445_09460 [Lachnospiraceae bacterium]|nr:hypothetical protein [Lachnospiraceae bacterium]MDD7378942.1 hypothetical protein [Lachnospiraceae bacterium]MDY4617922.1 hypothetical protein [Lachnospiraceae bacterium]